MKNLIYIIVAVMLLSGCSKFLDRQPLASISPNNAFNSENELQLYVNSFYSANLPNADDDNNGFYSLYNEDADNIVKNSMGDQLTGKRVVPVTDGAWGWSKLRNINYFLQNYGNGHLDTAVTYKYVAVARFFRAFFYFSMVTRYGDVPYFTKVPSEVDSTLLKLPRTSRVAVTDSIVADLDFAINHLGTAADPAAVTKWTALALKSRVCLFEGTFRKYHTEFKLSGAEDLLQKCVDASTQLMQGPYSIYTDDPSTSYRNLFSSYDPQRKEVILARQYSKSAQIFHNVNYYTIAASYGKPGLEKKLVNSYLMKDGSRFTDLQGYDTMTFVHEMQNRDPRLYQTIRTPGYTRLGSTIKLPTSFTATTTGYQLTKYVMGTADDAYMKCYNALSIFRYAEVLLNFAEARAELGTLTQGDLNNSIKLLRGRVGMPGLDMAQANANVDPYLAAQYSNVAAGGNQGVILEIRRERRIEMVMEGLRWNDLMRWKEGHLLALQYKGEYFPKPGQYDLDGDLKPDLEIYTTTKSSTSGLQFLKLGTDVQLENGANGGAIIVLGNVSKTFNENKDYLWPIPTQEMQLNPNLVQNPGW
ncbi:MAG: RagB/SusD family nutrient uptake outer membrane protein [Niabella sp.]|nr:RagB/SusD family nutrient uptake outer membrane protein [Niabella sp.]